MNSTSINKKIGQATKWSSITEIIAKIIIPITNMILARLLVPEAFGIVATISMVISFAELFTDAGFQKYIIQHEFADDGALDNSTNVAFWTNLGVSTFICIAIFIFRHQIASLVGNPELGDSISIASVLIVIAAFSSIQMARFRRALDFKTLFFVRVTTSLIPLVITVPLAVILRNYWALLIGSITSHLFNAILLTAHSKWKPKFYYSIKLFKEMFSFSAWTMLESISIWLTSYIGVFIVGNFLSDHYLGLYKTSISSVNGIMAVITSALTPVLFSALSRYQNDDVNYRKTYFQFQRLTATFVIPMGIGIYLYSDLGTQILLGRQWMEASDFIGLWGLTSAFMIVFSHFSGEVHRSKGKPKISLAGQLIHLAFLVPLLFWSAPLGFKALYITRSLTRLQGIISSFIFLHVLYKFTIWDNLKNTMPMIVSASLMGGAGYLMQQINSSMVWQFISALICVVIYFSILLGLFPCVRREVFSSAFGKKIIKKFKR